jgi:AcrR family transcriptional regulator
MNSNRKQHIHENICEEIKTAAWEQIAAGGIESLSLSAIARQMELTPPALYRYFASRDELVNALIADAHCSFAAGLDSARSSTPSTDYSGQVRAMCLGYHAWALAHPEQFRLIFGRLLPVETAQTGQPSSAGQAADRSFSVLLEALNAADRAGQIHPLLPVPAFPADLSGQLASVRQPGTDYPPRVLYLALQCWTFMHGITSLELNGQYAILLGDSADTFVRLEIERFLMAIGLVENRPE